MDTPNLRGIFAVALALIFVGSISCASSNSNTDAEEPAAPTDDGDADEAPPEDEPIGGGCAYDDVPGSITIAEIVPGPEGEYNCPNEGQRVVFDFAPDDASQASDRDSGQRLTVGAGANPPQSCLEPAGLTVGATFTARRRDITSGTCSPVVWDFDISNLNLCQEQCFEE